MHKMLRFIYTLPVLYILMVLAAFMDSCSRDVTNGNAFVPTLVVDGTIESGDYPRIFLTRNIPYYTDLDSSDMIYLVLRQAKVEVSDGVDSEILTVTYDARYFPPFYYVGTDLKGVAGKSYHLSIYYGKDTLHSVTTIPPPVTPDSVWFQEDPGRPGKGKIDVRISDDPLVNNYYKFYTSIQGQQNDYYPTLVSTYSDQAFNGKTFTFQLNNGPETYLNLNRTDFYYSKGDTVWVKVCTMDKASFDFWDAYQTEIINGGNPFASSFHSIPSDINGNGTGIWSGYGTNVYRVVCK